MNKLGLGGAFLDQASHAEGIALIRHALACGITYIDTSPMYMQGRSQALIGEALAGITPPKNLTLATKLGYLPAIEDFHNPEKLLAQFEQNQTLLGHPITLLQLHEADLSRWWTLDPNAPFRIHPAHPPDFKSAPAFKTLVNLKNTGKVARIGISGNDAPAMSTVFDALDVDSLLLAFNYTLIHRAARDHALPAAVKRNVPFINAGALYCGRLAAPNPAWLTPESRPNWLPPHEIPKYQALYDLAAHTNLSLPELTVGFLLADPRIHLTLFGPSTRAELDTLLSAAQKGPLPPDLHAKVEAIHSL
jgi:aryl-alcohol dehydrogenase-like predicted oxidoreductase